MRADAIGLFWQDLPRKKGDRTARVMPPIPETGWKAPTEFPNLAAARALSFDVETYDPELDEFGPGWARHKGHIVGLGVGTDDGRRWYFPMRHTVKKEENLDPNHVLAWARDTLCDNRPKLGANITYDVGWLREEGVFVRGDLFDVQFAEALLYESATINLDDLGERYLGYGKTTNVLYEWCSAYYRGNPTPVQRKNIYRAPPSLVGPYAEGDVDIPFGVMERQWSSLISQGLLELFFLECQLIPLMVEMRFQGVRIDLDVAEQLREVMDDELKVVDKEIERVVGFSINANAGDSIAQAFDALGLHYFRTEKTGKPSFTKQFLKTVEHPIGGLIRKKREYEKLKGTFIESYLLASNVNGRVHCQFHQLRSDGGGARSGRYSSSDPNLQNIPIRSELGKKIRRAFIPEEGHKDWQKRDYSQIEYRALAHYAVGPGSDEVRRRYNEDPTTDFHVVVQDLVRIIAHQNLDRPLVKNVNFGVTYGMGEAGLARYINLARAKAKELFDAIHHAAPFLKSTMDATMQEANFFGFITTILGRRSRFDLWVPNHWDENAVPVPYDKAILWYPNPQRAYLHKALNRRLQGSAADLIKKAMLDCYKAGLFDEIGVPKLTVHDELDFSNPGGKDHVFKEVDRIMETCIPFKVPIKVGVEIGTSWGTVEDA